MPNVIVYDRKGNQVILNPTDKEGMYEKLNADESDSGSLINLDTSIQCGSLFTEEQHQKYLANKKKGRNKK